MKSPLSAVSSITTLVALLFSGCGGGGGGGESFVGAATVVVRTAPNRIDSGDRTLTTIEVGSVHENGVALKIRFPSGLRYVSGSSLLAVDSREIDISPTVNSISRAESQTYLVFYLPQNLFKRANEPYKGESGTVTLQLEGRTEVERGSIDVDADVDDPAENNATEFDIEAPEFISESSASIEVIVE
jgi:hypothetical protein